MAEQVRTKAHQSQADELAADIEAFLAKGGEVQQMPDDMSGDSYLIKIDRGLKNVSPSRSGKPRQFKFNGAL